MPRPVFFLVAEDVPCLEELTRDLCRRYDADYRVAGAASAAAALSPDVGACDVVIIGAGPAGLAAAGRVGSG